MLAFRELESGAAGGMTTSSPSAVRSRRRSGLARQRRQKASSLRRRPGRNFRVSCPDGVMDRPPRPTDSDRDLLRPLGPPVLAQAAVDSLIEIEDFVALL